MRVLLAVILTAIITVILTWEGAMFYHREQLGEIIVNGCPQLILNPNDLEVWLIRSPDGAYIPIRPRAPKPKN